jgi:aryl-alcohol dehydrogenase-like predicted oxidoreductase
MTGITRRNFTTLAGAAVFARTACAQTRDAAVISRAIPSTGELVPPVGLGTAYVFDRNDERTRHIAAEVVRTLLDAGARLIDTASTYGDAEDVIGGIIAHEGVREGSFIATNWKYLMSSSGRSHD